VFSILVLLLVLIDFVPEPVVSTGAHNAVLLAQSTEEHSEIVPIPVPPVEEGPRSSVPVRIVVESIGIDTPVVTPERNEVSVLDRALLSGAVHYPQSALAGEKGTMLIFGHSSYLPVVQNKAFQAFNELGKLKPGEQIVVYTETHVFTYKVKQVKLARADEVTIHFDTEAPILTLATCNTFGAKEERWVATAEFVGEERITDI
jgi:LPXTG-site transpeptidase (sortase) family protein